MADVKLPPLRYMNLEMGDKTTDAQAQGNEMEFTDVVGTTGLRPGYPVASCRVLYDYARARGKTAERSKDALNVVLSDLDVYVQQLKGRESLEQIHAVLMDHVFDLALRLGTVFDRIPFGQYTAEGRVLEQNVSWCLRVEYMRRVRYLAIIEECGYCGLHPDYIYHCNGSSEGETLPRIYDYTVDFVDMKSLSRSQQLAWSAYMGVHLLWELANAFEMMDKVARMLRCFDPLLEWYVKYPVDISMATYGFWLSHLPKK